INVRLPCAAFVALFTPIIAAHHSTAEYDFSTEVVFAGEVLTVEFQNPHIALTLVGEGPDGRRRIVDFIEGPGANAVLRQGLAPEALAPGAKITAVGPPRHDNARKFYLRRIRLKNGQEF